MSEQSLEQVKEPLSYMKQWFLTKLQSQSSITEETSSGVPTIVISEGSNRSINRFPGSPLLNLRPSPKARTWMNGERCSSFRSTGGESPCVSPLTGRNEHVTGGMARLNKSTSARDKMMLSKSKSVPTTPFLESSAVQLQSPGYSSLKCASPVFRFPAYILPNSTPMGSKSELDYPSVCASCGQEKYTGSRELIGFRDHPPSRNASAATTPHATRRGGRSLNLRRTISCRTSGGDRFEQLTHSGSANFDDSRPSPANRRRKIKRTGSREKSRSTISLTRSWSINIDSLKLVKTSPSRSVDRRKMSLNDNDLARVGERRRSSLSRLLCVNQSDDDHNLDDESCNDESAMSFSSVEDILTYSPEVTRTIKFSKGGDPVEDFRSTFESDSIRVPSAYGQVKLMFQYFNEKNELHVTLLKCINVANGHRGTLGVYAKLCIMPGKLEKKISNDTHDTHDPVFYELFTFRMPLGDLLNKSLRIKLYNKPGIFSISQPVGECSIPLYDYDLTAVSVIWQNLKISRRQKRMDLDEFDLDFIESGEKNKRTLSALLCGLRGTP